MAGGTSSPPSPHEKVENPNQIIPQQPSFVSSNDSNENQAFKRAANKIELQQPSSTFIGTQQIFLDNQVVGNTPKGDRYNIMDISVLKPVSLFQGKPSIAFQQSEKLALIEKLQYVLIAKSSHGRPSMASIRSYFSSLQLKGDPLISVLDSKHLVIECKLFEDFTKLWIKRSLVIGGFFFRIFKWSEDFSPQKESPLSPVWIHLPRLPLYLFDEAALMSIGNAIGKPLRLDSRNTSHVKLAYASICVELDVSKPKIDDIWISFVEKGSTIDGFWQHIVYDSIPPYCVNCNHLGHTIDVCKRKILQGIKETPADNGLNDSGVVLGDNKRGLQQCFEHKECEQGDQCLLAQRNKEVSNLVELESTIEEGEIVGSTKDVDIVFVSEGCVKGIKQLEGMLFKGLMEHDEHVLLFTKESGDENTAEFGLVVQKGEEDDNSLKECLLQPAILESEENVQSVQSAAGESTGVDAGMAAAVWEGAAGHAFDVQAVATECSDITQAVATELADGMTTHTRESRPCAIAGETTTKMIVAEVLRSAANCNQAGGQGSIQDGFVHGNKPSQSARLGTMEPAAEMTHEPAAGSHLANALELQEENCPLTMLKELHENSLQEGEQKTEHNLVQNPCEQTTFFAAEVIQNCRDEMDCLDGALGRDSGVETAAGHILQQLFAPAGDSTDWAMAQTMNKVAVLKGADATVPRCPGRDARATQQSIVLQEPCKSIQQRSISQQVQGSPESDTTGYGVENAKPKKDGNAYGEQEEGVSSDQQTAADSNAILEWDAAQVRAFVHNQIEEIKQEIGQTEPKIRDTAKEEKKEQLIRDAAKQAKKAKKERERKNLKEYFMASAEKINSDLERKRSEQKRKTTGNSFKDGEG